MNEIGIKDIKDIDSSLNEIDVEMSNIMHKLMLHADPRYINKNIDTPLWSRDRVILVDELETKEIFNAYLISNDKKKIDITYPICAIHPNDINEVFYGTGNRIGQWEFLMDQDIEEFQVGSTAYVIRGNEKGIKGTIISIIKIVTIIIMLSVSKGKIIIK